MSTAPIPIHRHRGLGLQPTLAALAALVVAAILIALLVDRIFFGSSSPVGIGSGVAATQARSLPPFGDVDLAGANNVIVHVGMRQSVIVHADTNLLSRVTTQVRSGSLVIGATPGPLNAKSPMFVDVNLPSLGAVALQGSGNITVTGISGRTLTAMVQGSGTIDASGTTTRLDVTISGSGTGLLDQLIARDVSASVSGSGSIMLTATHSLNARVSDSGTILYSGNPSRHTTSVTGSGTFTNTAVSRRRSPPGASDSALSARQLAGERVIYSYRGLTPPASLVAQIRAGQAAGVIFYGDNIASKAQIQRVIAQLQKDATASPVKLPLLMMTDQEGGQVRRLPGAPSRSEKQIGQSANPAAATQAGRGAGVNLRGAGMNLNLAPVLDVYRNAGNFIDRYGRSYSKNPRKVAQLGADFIGAQQRTGVAASAKHFPGLGAATASRNTDVDPVTLSVPLASLRSIDELPYRSAISTHVKLIMVSWAIYPALDPDRPAGLSSRIVQNELRKRLTLQERHNHRRTRSRRAACLREHRQPRGARRPRRHGPAPVRKPESPPRHRRDQRARPGTE